MKITSKNSIKAFKKWDRNYNTSIMGGWSAWNAGVNWAKRELRKTSRIEEMRKKFPNIKWTNTPVLKRSRGVIHRIKENR